VTILLADPAKVDADFTLDSGPPGLADAFRTQAARCLGAVADS
jgi:hypothetical protein